MAKLVLLKGLTAETRRHKAGAEENAKFGLLFRIIIDLLFFLIICVSFAPLRLRGENY